MITRTLWVEVGKGKILWGSIRFKNHLIISTAKTPAKLISKIVDQIVDNNLTPPYPIINIKYRKSINHEK